MKSYGADYSWLNLSSQSRKPQLRRAVLGYLRQIVADTDVSLDDALQAAGRQTSSTNCHNGKSGRHLAHFPACHWSTLSGQISGGTERFETSLWFKKIIFLFFCSRNLNLTNDSRLKINKHLANLHLRIFCIFLLLLDMFQTRHK